MISLNDGWKFRFRESDNCWEDVRIPHTVQNVPLHYASPEYYETVCSYRKELRIPREWSRKRLFLQFDGAAHEATVFFNGTEVCVHRCGYTSFRAEITELVRFEESNEILVRLDTRESLNIPPFGFVIDYLTYGGLYRDVWLDVRPQDYIEDIFVSTPSVYSVRVQVTAPLPADISIYNGEHCLARGHGNDITLTVPKAEPWTPDSPKLFTCRAALPNGDLREVIFGFRTLVFKEDGLYLNGTKTFLRGLNRHQSYPYIGYAAPRSLQEEDARILKEELQCNAVRTSHYPQSQYFIDACDRLGLLVFTEIPGWQYLGDEAWKAQALENTREMVLQYRNHPSLILYGVRINESQDDDELYRKTNAIAHSLDGTRPTTGVRFLEKSSFLEDVYAYNDFSHDGTTPPCMPKNKVSPDCSKALIISECNGHMFPTKPFDNSLHRQEHALRHARLQYTAKNSGEHAGCFGWCMFDYPTHKDFGSGDRVCYHGVLDAFRNPKLAASVYASLGNQSPVLEVSSTMDLGDYPAGKIGKVYAFTNGASVDLFKNNCFVGTFRNLGGPVEIDDFIGNLLESQEGMDRNEAEVIRSCLKAAESYGLPNLPAQYKLKLAWCMLRYRLKFEDGYRLYSRYVGNWGTEATVWRFDAKDESGNVIASVTRSPGTKLHLEIRVSRSELTEAASYDMAAVRIRVLDEFGNPAVYDQRPLRLRTEGSIALVGPEIVSCEGGCSGCYVRTTGAEGPGTLYVNDVAVPFSVQLIPTERL